ncbi:MAG: hypothetical protein F6K42_03845 [Leptolyngbya sp. SIO1D8]|nr:hypothetical protein [Leptolyngbya sp. SIO1D8]
MKAAMKKGLLVGLLILLCWFGTVLAGQAQVGDIRLESRVRSLESEMSRMRSRLTQLAAQISGSQADLSLPAASPLLEPSLEEQFDNLATLAIELKQQVRALEERVTSLEGQPVDSSPGQGNE